MNAYFQDYFTRRYFARGYFGPTESSPGDVTFRLDQATSDSRAYSLLVVESSANLPNGRRKTWFDVLNERRDAEIQFSGSRATTRANTLSIWAVSEKPVVKTVVRSEIKPKPIKIPLYARMTGSSVSTGANSMTITMEAVIDMNGASNNTGANKLGSIKKVSNPTDAEIAMILEMFL